MLIEQIELQRQTSGRGTTELTTDIQQWLATVPIKTGLCNLFIRHTSASLLLTENADPAVRRDIDAALSRLAPDGNPAYEHDAEGPDDMAAHLRSLLTNTSLSIPVADGQLALGTWQGVYLYEHRVAPHVRHIFLTALGR